jgi:integrase
MSETIEVARAILADLEGKLAGARAKAVELDRRRAQISYRAHTSDGKAAAELTAMNRARAELALEIDSIEAAIAEREGRAIPAWVLHDLRRSVASGLAALGIGVHVVEKVLNHQSGTFRSIVSVYQKHDYASEKRAALQAWGRHVERLASGKPASNVVEFAEAARA